MDFDLKDEQQQLSDSLGRYLSQHYSFAQRRQSAQKATRADDTHWRQFAALGLMSLGLPEQSGGTGSASNIGGDGAAAEDIMIVMQALGRHLVVEPYWATVVLCGTVLRQATANVVTPKVTRTVEALLTSIVAGDTKLALAVHEREGGYNASYVATTATTATTATATGEAHYLLSGRKAVVIHGDVADQFIVAARTRGAVSEHDGISLFAVPKDSPGLEVISYPTNDGLGAADLLLNNVQVNHSALLGPLHSAWPIIESALAHGMAALCAEAVGIMDALVAQTVDYLKTRRQFGVTIGSFQVLQHRVVDMFIATEQARSMMILAALKVGADDAQARHTIAAAKALVGQSARFVGQQAVQLHGGMGVTDELIVSHYFKRLTAIDLVLGDAHYHRARLGELLAA
jgi:alkylation response protein AidB-like acyl-CoA dehydrogenase